MLRVLIVEGMSNECNEHTSCLELVCTAACVRCDSSTACRLCRLELIVLGDLSHPINDSEKDLTRKERATLAQLRSGYWKLLCSYKGRIKKDVSLHVCADCGKTPHDVKHLFACPAHPTTLIPSDLWSKPMDSIREFIYFEAGNLD